jgi:hypothetical protein
MKTLDAAVVELGGVLKPDFNAGYTVSGDYVRDVEAGLGDIVCTKAEFQQRAKELGFVNGYRWGVEYTTNGKKPELPDDVVVYARNYGDGCGKGSEVKSFYWPDYYKFKIADDRYKPTDTSYLDKPESSRDSAESSLDSAAGWYDYENKEALRLPPVGVECEWSGNGGRHWHKTALVFSDQTVFLTRGYQLYKTADDSVEFRPLDWNRKAEAEKKRVVDAARDFLGCMRPQLESLYDAGYLRMPEDKS